MPQSQHSILSCHSVYKSFPQCGQNQATVLANLNLDIPQGGFVSILGQSGSGKSTFLKLLGGFVPPSAGKVLFHGQPLQGINSKISMVFQENNLYPWLTVEQNIAFGFKARGKKPHAYKRRVKDVIEMVGLDHAKTLYPHQISGGMKQRVAIARAMAIRPDVLLLDEPFSALDIPLRRRLQAFLYSVWQELSTWRELSTTMVLVTHSVEEAILLGQHLIVIGDRPGRIIQRTDISDLAFRDRYSPQFLLLQRSLESLLDQDPVGETIGLNSPA
ncbi:MAG: ABC transporter ATP-binding protein [Cyanobacteria bacterium P01_A01_bin.123]